MQFYVKLNVETLKIACIETPCIQTCISLCVLTGIDKFQLDMKVDSYIHIISEDYNLSPRG